MASKKTKLKVISLGGLHEIGKNMTVIEYNQDIIIIDCGLAFPEDDMLGIDMVIPDITYLQKNADKVRGIVLTHGHEDHIGALPYILKELNVPVICLSQLARGPENRQDHRPMLADLRESGSIEQDADIVLFLYRDGYYNEELENQSEAECIISKNRHGETGTVKLAWLGEYTLFRSLDTTAR